MFTIPILAFTMSDPGVHVADEATRLGWEASRIVVIDADPGISGRTASARMGFRELVGRVCVGEVGAIFGLEVSRLARSSADLQLLLELCSLSDTLIIDSDGTYDLAQFNDRLLLGLKGTMSEAELHLLAGRLHGAKQVAAGRGALRFPLPVGYVYDEARATVLDPDEETGGCPRSLRSVHGDGIDLGVRAARPGSFPHPGCERLAVFEFIEGWSRCAPASLFSRLWISRSDTWRR